jgi:hypothetical protein
MRKRIRRHVYLLGKEGCTIPLSQVPWDTPTISRWRDILLGNRINVNGNHRMVVGFYPLKAARNKKRVEHLSKVAPGRSQKC